MSERKAQQFAVAASPEIIERGHELLDKFPGSTKEERLSKMLDLAEAELSLQGMSPRFDSHLRALVDSAENIKASALALVKAADERINRETNDLKDISASKDRALAEKQKENDALRKQLDDALAQTQSAKEEADNVREALTKELNERNAHLNDLRKRIDEQSLTIQLQEDKSHHQEEALQEARKEIQRLHNELREKEEQQKARDETQLLWDEFQDDLID